MYGCDPVSRQNKAHIKLVSDMGWFCKGGDESQLKTLFLLK